MNTEYPRSQKEPSVRFDSSREDGLQVLWEDNERAFCRRWHASADGSSGSVLVVLPASEHPSPSNLERLADEYGLRDELDSAWAVRPLALKREHGRIVLVLEDWGGEPLDRLLSTPMEIGSFLRLAIGIVTTLGKMHRRGLIHKDIKPANIVVNCEDGQARLTGFGIASRLPRERQAPEPPEVIAGTLAYMAPEQTGRMNCSSTREATSMRSASRSIRCSPAVCRSARPIRWNGSTVTSRESRLRLRDGWKAFLPRSPRS